MPCKGIGVTAKNIPWSRTRRKPGERRGPGWKMSPVMRTDEVRHVVIDTNDWATRLAHRWASPIGTPGAWSLYKAPHALHRMLADQLTTDRPTETSGQGRTLYEWITPPGADNHWGDALRMAAVAASIAGVSVPGEGKAREASYKRITEKPRKRTMAQRQAEALAKRRAG